MNDFKSLSKYRLMDLQASPIYQPLNGPDAIRLLTLHPSPTYGADIYGDLFPSSLSHWKTELVENYMALSYVWGHPTVDSLCSLMVSAWGLQRI